MYFCPAYNIVPSSGQPAACQATTTTRFIEATLASESHISKESLDGCRPCRAVSLRGLWRFYLKYYYNESVIILSQLSECKERFPRAISRMKGLKLWAVRTKSDLRFVTLMPSSPTLLQPVVTSRLADPHLRRAVRL